MTPQHRPLHGCREKRETESERQGERELLTQKGEVGKKMEVPGKEAWLWTEVQVG